MMSNIGVIRLIILSFKNSSILISIPPLAAVFYEKVFFEFTLRAFSTRKYTLFPASTQIYAVESIFRRKLFAVKENFVNNM